MAARTIGEQIHPEHSTHPEIGRRLPPLHDPPSFLIGMSPHSNVKRIDLPGRAVKPALYPPPFQSAADTQYSTLRSSIHPFRYPPSDAVRAASACHFAQRRLCWCRAPCPRRRFGGSGPPRNWVTRGTCPL